MNPQFKEAKEAKRNSCIQAAWTHSCGHLARARLKLKPTSLFKTAVNQLPLNSPTRTDPAAKINPMSLVGRPVQPLPTRRATTAVSQQLPSAEDAMDGCQVTNAEDVALLPVYMLHETYIQTVTDYSRMKQDLSNSKQEIMELKRNLSDLEAEITKLRATREDDGLASSNGHKELQVTAALTPIYKAEMEQLKELLILERQSRAEEKELLILECHTRAEENKLAAVWEQKNNMYENALGVALAEIEQLKAQLQNSCTILN